MTRREIVRFALVKSSPILFSYLFVSMAYGILMAEAGFPWAAALLVSLTVYTGAFQFVLTALLSSGASLITIAVTALFMNSRQAFYSLSFVNDFQHMGPRKPYMIHTMTDETYAVNCTLHLPDGDRREVMFWVAVFARCSWMLGAVLGGALPSAIMAVLIVYCLRHAKTDIVGTGVPAAAAVLIVAASYKWKHKTFPSIILGTAAYMLLTRTMGL